MKTLLTTEEYRYGVKALVRYWPHREEIILQLPIPQVQLELLRDLSLQSLPPQLKLVELPDWAREIGVEGKLLVPAHLILEQKGVPWQQTDWLAVIFWYLSGLAEQAFEQRYGPIHSYSFRLKGWDSRLWERAWVNRIALFLRRWAAREQGISEESLFGALPQPEVILTHDVDAVTKTTAIRLKQTVFHLFGAVRNFSQGKLSASWKKLLKAGAFFISQDNYWYFDTITALEAKYGVRSYFNIYGGLASKLNFKKLLIDPSYDVHELRLKQQLQAMHARGWKIGLHQSSAAWEDAALMQQERQQVEAALEFPVTSCRQHWLYFSWEKTWQAQQAAGLRLDSTLGFNNRSGFRTGAALRYCPWNIESQSPMSLEMIPMVLMDSHLYDYGDLEDNQRRQEMRYWIEEIYQVKGTASVIWHQRVMSPDYDWYQSYQNLLDYLKVD
ncbi:MAG: hypothetical protein F6J86_12545 [Symploca sp. SIO1B1]|nr:hypothetical protein [Symploca sp. SIO1B1]